MLTHDIDKGAAKQNGFVLEIGEKAGVPIDKALRSQKQNQCQQIVAKLDERVLRIKQAAENSPAPEHARKNSRNKAKKQRNEAKAPNKQRDRS